MSYEPWADRGDDGLNREAPMPDVVLIFPPTTKPSEPPVGVCTLAGWLQEQGLDCLVIDARMEFLERSLDGDLLEPFRESKTYAEPDRYLGCLARLNEALRALCTATDRLSITDHRPADRPLFSRRDIRASVDESRVFEPDMARLADRVVSLSPELVGISIGYLSQLVAGLQLWRHLARQAPSLPVVLGGSLICSWQHHLQAEPLLDGERYAFGPGQLALASLLREVGLPFAPTTAAPRYAELLKRHRYLAPEPIGSVALSEGCWWGRCTFCHEAGAAAYAPLSTDGIVRIVDGLLDQGVSLIHVTDHAIAPKALRLLARCLRSRPARWYGFARLEPAMTERPFAAALAASGCAMLEIGLESASPRVLAAMHKGHDPELASGAIRVLAEAGIRVFLYVMFGFPGETDADRELTLRFLEAHAPWIHGINVSIFNLPVGSPLEREPARFGIERLMPFRPGQELSFYRDFVAGHDRMAVRRFLAQRLRRSELLAPVLRRTLRSFKSNHAPFVPLPASPRESH